MMDSFYNRHAALYDFLAFASERLLLDRGLSLLNLQRGERVLEIGFGPGRTLATMGKSVGLSGEILGIDAAPAMVNIATNRISKEHLGDYVHPIHGDILSWQPPIQTFDAIFMAFTLELFDDGQIDVVLEKCQKTLRAGGRIAIVALSENGKGFGKLIYWWLHDVLPNVFDCRPIRVNQLLRRAGFRIERGELINWWIPVEIVLAVR